MSQMNLEKALDIQLVLNEFIPAHTLPGAIFQLSVVTIGLLGLFFAIVTPRDIVDSIAMAVKHRKITPGEVQRLIKDMRAVGLEPKKLTDPAHTAIFTKVVKKLIKAESETETAAVKQELEKMLTDFWPYQHGQIRDAMNKVSKENKISLAHKIKYFFNLEE
jgi:hypothetical protein